MLGFTSDGFWCPPSSLSTPVQQPSLVPPPECLGRPSVGFLDPARPVAADPVSVFAASVTLVGPVLPSVVVEEVPGAPDVDDLVPQIISISEESS